jgi:hypothetical protein
MRDRVLHVEKFARGNWNFREVEKEARHAVTIPSKLFIHAFYVLSLPPFLPRQTYVLQVTTRDYLLQALQINENIRLLSLGHMRTKVYPIY